MLQYQVDGERQNVVPPLTQWRHVHREDVDAEVQVLAKGLRLDHRSQIAVGRGDHAGVDLAFLATADGSHRALLEHAQQMNLRGWRELTNLVEQDGSAIGLLEQPDVAA